PPPATSWRSGTAPRRGCSSMGASIQRRSRRGTPSWAGGTSTTSWMTRSAEMGGHMTGPDPATRFRRQLDLLPLDRLDVPVTVLGAGAVGSFVTLTLCKMGLRDLTVFDDDIVDVHN